MQRKLSLVIPTYNERENIIKLIDRLAWQFERHHIAAEIIVVDDNSPDGTGDLVAGYKYKNLKLVRRAGKQGLSSAVIAGWRVASGDVLGVMDADLSHPPARLPRLFVAIGAGADIAIGSRYIRGGKIVGWGFKRKLMSDVATLLAHLFTDVHDPMTGYFLVRRETLDGVTLDPQGFKLLLEVLIKARYQQVVEIPITFTNRTAGKSKAGIGETFAYLANLMRYLPYKRSVIMQFGKFALVGASGTLLNLAIVYLLTSRLEMHYILSAVIAFIVAMSSNFILNSLWTFRGSLERRAGTRYLQFALVSVLTLVINLLVLAFLTEILGLYYLLSQLIGIGIGLIFNFVGNKVWTYAR